MTIKQQRILISNDDGIDAKGLKHLIEIAQEFGHVTVVAPEKGMSGMSHSITMSDPIYLRRIEYSDNIEIYACAGTPTDCIKIAIDTLMPEQPTLVLSGINHGANSNISVIYSGTMAAAIEGSTYSIPSIGFSLTSHDLDADFTAARHYVREVIIKLLSTKNNENICLNVNIPTIPLEKIKGIKVCRQSKGYWREDFTQQFCPRGKEYYWLKGYFINQEPDATDNDEWALKNNYVSVVPVQIDITNYEQLRNLKSW